jgi:hypothetical protein
MITMAVLKSYGAEGVSLTAKSNFWNIGRSTDGQLNYSHVVIRKEGTPTNNGYNKYRVCVDFMGSKYLGQNTLFGLSKACSGVVQAKLRVLLNISGHRLIMTGVILCSCRSILLQ